MTIKYGQKFCTKCKTLKPLSDFYPRKDYKFGVDFQCKDCTNKYDRECYRKRRKEVLDSMGGKCVYCGCELFEALQINHKHGGGYQERKAKKHASLADEISFGRRKTDDLEVVCYVCNAWHKLVKLDGLPDGWTITWEDPNEL